jgi:TPR repeat protein
MNVLVAPLIIVLLLVLAGCGEEIPEKPENSEPMMLMDEMTATGGLPTILSEGLTAEEQADMLNQIIPTGSDEDEVTSGEKFEALLEQARAGDARSQNELGFMYFTGEAVSTTATGEVLQNDPVLAAGWFYRAAEQGYADAQFNLGLLYVNGEGVEMDAAKAVELFYQAAEQGNVDAQNNLAAMYYTGEGVGRDVDKAIAWFEKAAGQGNVDAQANLEAIRAAN